MLSEQFRKTRQGCNCLFQKTPRTEGGDKVRSSVDPRFAAGLPFPVFEILEFATREHFPELKNFPWERGSGGVQSTGVSQRVRVTGRDES